MDLSSVPALASAPLPRHWAVVFELTDPEREAQQPQPVDPEGEAERALLSLYTQTAIDPSLLSTGTMELFPCPACGAEVRAELPPSHEPRPEYYSACRGCGAHLTRLPADLMWSVKPVRPKPASCLCCDDPANSAEHVIPEWVSKQLGVRDVAYMVEETDERAWRRKQPISFASYKARILCKSCNQHFGLLEEAVIPLLVPMARGMPVSLGVESRALLALWAAKTGLMLSAAEPELRGTIPRAHGQAIRSGVVPPGVWVGIFEWAGGVSLSTSRTVVEGPWGATETYRAILAFAKLGIVVTGLSTPDTPKAVVADRAGRLHQFWPPRGALVHWAAS
jgi:hypothetical protein